MLFSSHKPVGPGVTHAQAPSKARRDDSIPWMKLTALLKGSELLRATKVFCCTLEERGFEGKHQVQPYFGHHPRARSPSQQVAMANGRRQHSGGDPCASAQGWETQRSPDAAASPAKGDFLLLQEHAETFPALQILFRRLWEAALTPDHGPLLIIPARTLNQPVSNLISGSLDSAGSNWW